jgi:hypothetical protein
VIGEAGRQILELAHKLPPENYTLRQIFHCAEPKVIGATTCLVAGCFRNRGFVRNLRRPLATGGGFGFVLPSEPFTMPMLSMPC